MFKEKTSCPILYIHWPRPHKDHERLGSGTHGPHVARPPSFPGHVTSGSFLTCLLVLTFILLKSIKHCNQPRPRNSSFPRPLSYPAPTDAFSLFPKSNENSCLTFKFLSVCFAELFVGRARVIMVCNPSLPSSLPLSAPFCFY